MTFSRIQAIALERHRIAVVCDARVDGAFFIAGTDEIPHVLLAHSELEAVSWLYEFQGGASRVTGEGIQAPVVTSRDINIPDGLIAISPDTLQAILEAAHWPIIFYRLLAEEREAGKVEPGASWGKSDDEIMHKIRCRQAELESALRKAEIASRDSHGELNTVRFVRCLEEQLYAARPCPSSIPGSVTEEVAV